MNKVKIGISTGDLNGIGLEVILKVLADSRITNRCVPIIYGSSKVVSYHKNIVGVDFNFHQTRSADRLTEDRMNVVNCWQENVNISLGRPSEESGRYAVTSLDCATKELKSGLIDALVTAPINKQAMQISGFSFPGHTEYLSDQFGVAESLMFMVSDDLRIGLVTNHLPIEVVAARITKELVIEKLRIMEESLRVDFGVEKPTIAVLGLNPHAGEGGILGQEEDKIIRPAIVESKKKGMLAMGPFPADGFFGSGQYKKFDGILAMYHDQGLVPFKLLSFGKGVNFTAGLPVVRTSPDHGTGFDIAGKNLADPGSFMTAMFSAIDIVSNRNRYKEMREGALVRKAAIAEEEGDIVE